MVMLVCALAMWRGGSVERLAAGGMLAAWALSMVAASDRSGEMQGGVLLIDGLALALFAWIALRSRRWWPLFTAGFQLLAVITHLARALDDNVTGWAYFTAEIIWGYLVLFSIGYAAWTAPHHADVEIAPPGARRR